MELTRKQIEHLYLPPADDFVTVDVPRMQFIMIDGQGNPNSDAHAHAMQWLFASVYPIKRMARQRMGKNFIEPPVEGLWWADDMADFIAHNMDKLKWRMLHPASLDWLTEEVFADAVAEAGQRLGEPPESLRLDDYDEGLSVQIMHIGPPAEQCETMTRLHTQYLPQHNLACNGPHHEIYLTDPRRVAPEKQKTVLRQPVCRVR